MLDIKPPYYAQTTRLNQFKYAENENIYIPKHKTTMELIKQFEKCIITQY